MTRSFFVVVVLAALAGGCSHRSSDAAGDVRAVVDRYVKAVNDGDENAVRELLADPQQISYVNPMQRLRSWPALQEFWQVSLKNAFSRRELKPSNVAVEVAGDAAWAVFDWEFTATQSDGKPYQARGWETHVYRRTARGWRIAHVHYSVPPPPPSGGQPGQ